MLVGLGSQPEALVLCTQEMRLCPDGSPMDREAGSCEWDPTSCPGAAAPADRSWILLPLAILGVLFLVS